MTRAASSLLLAACASTSHDKPDSAANAVPETFVGDESVRYTDLSAGSHLACTVDEVGFVRCWAGTISTCLQPPASLVAADVDVRGGAEPCAIEAANRDVVCWDVQTNEVTRTLEGPFASLSGGCALRVDGTIACWSAFDDCPTDPPSGTYASLDSGHSGAAVSDEGSLVLWGPYTCEEFDIKGSDCVRCPDRGSFAGPYVLPAHAALYSGGCGVLEAGGVSCFEGSRPGLGVGAPASGSWVDLDVRDFSSGCALGASGTATCWGLTTDVPTVPFRQLENMGNLAWCGLGTDGVVSCWADVLPYRWSACTQ